MNLEKVNVFYEEGYHIVLVLDSIERRDPQKLVKFLFWRWQLYLQLSHKGFIRKRSYFGRLCVDLSPCLFQTSDLRKTAGPLIDTGNTTGLKSLLRLE